MKIFNFGGSKAVLGDVDFGATAEADFKAQAAAALADLVGAVNTAAATGAVTDTDLLMAYEKQLITDLRALISTIGTPLTAANIQTEATDAIKDVFGGAATNYQRQVTKTITGTHPTGFVTDPTAMFTGTGSVMLVFVGTKVITAIENAATTLKYSVVVDSLAAVDICAATTITNFAVKSFLALTGIFADVMSGAGTTAIGVIALNPAPILISSTTDFSITYTFSAASDGAIKAEFLWIPLSASATLVAA